MDAGLKYETRNAFFNALRTKRLPVKTIDGIHLFYGISFRSRILPSFMDESPAAASALIRSGVQKVHFFLLAERFCSNRFPLFREEMQVNTGFFLRAVESHHKILPALQKNCTFCTFTPRNKLKNPLPDCREGDCFIPSYGCICTPSALTDHISGPAPSHSSCRWHKQDNT